MQNEDDHKKTRPTVVAVNISSGGIPKRPVPEVRLTVDGLEGDFHEHEKHCRPDRAVSIHDVELLEVIRQEGFAVGPGLMGENLTVKNLDVQSMSPNDRLQIGDEVVLELTSVRKPCFVLDSIHARLKDVVVGRCGFMARVLQTGILRPGQRITVIRPNEALHNS